MTRRNTKKKQQAREMLTPARAENAAATVNELNQTETLGGRKNEFTISLIDPLFAVAIHIGLAETVFITKWFHEGRLPESAEWFPLLVFLVAFFNLLSSWFGYHLSIARRPIKDDWRYVVDVLLVCLYAASMAAAEHLGVVLILFSAIWALYAVWDVLKVREYYSEYQVSQGGFFKRYRREAVSFIFCLAFVLLFAGYRVFSFEGKHGVFLLAAAILSVLYRIAKRTKLFF